MTTSRVLVADDVKDSADTLADLLAAQGLEARAVYDGRDALRLAETWRPDGACSGPDRVLPTNRCCVEPLK